MAVSNNNRISPLPILGEAGKIDFEQFKRHLSSKKMRQEKQRAILIHNKEIRRELKEKRSVGRKRSNKKSV